MTSLSSWNAITSDLLYKEILAKEPQTTTELWAVADKFAKIDEATKRRREGDRGETSDKKKKDDTPRKNVMERIQRGPLESCLGPRQNSAFPPRSQFPPQPAQRDAPQFTPLMKARAEILELHANLFEQPRPMRDNGKPISNDKFCLFHEDYGHETENCKNLMYDIESLVRSGPLKKYLTGVQESTSLTPHKVKRRKGNIEVLAAAPKPRRKPSTRTMLTRMETNNTMVSLPRSPGLPKDRRSPP